MSRFMLNALFVIILVLLTSCATTPPMNWNDPQEISSKINVQYDNFKKVTEFTGPIVRLEYSGYFFIRAWKYDNDNEITYQIYVKDRYADDWRYYDSAYDSDGNIIDVTLIAQKVDSCYDWGCMLEEHIGLNVDKSYLEKHIESGLRFKVSGKAGENIFYLTGSYIKAFLEVVKTNNKVFM